MHSSSIFFTLFFLFFFFSLSHSDVTGRWNKWCCTGTGGHISSFWCLSLQPQAHYIFHSATAYWQSVPLQPAHRTLIFRSVRGINNWSGVGEVSHIDSFSLKKYVGDEKPLCLATIPYRQYLSLSAKAAEADPVLETVHSLWRWCTFFCNEKCKMKNSVFVVSSLNHRPPFFLFAASRPAPPETKNTRLFFLSKLMLKLHLPRVWKRTKANLRERIKHPTQGAVTNLGEIQVQYHLAVSHQRRLKRFRSHFLKIGASWGIKDFLVESPERKTHWLLWRLCWIYGRVCVHTVPSKAEWG